jgi:hypothetical protein
MSFASFTIVVPFFLSGLLTVLPAKIMGDWYKEVA